MGMCQGDPFIQPLFVLVHFHALQTFFVVFPSCLFPLLVNDTHILNLVSLVPLAFDHSTSQLVLMGLAK
jgi:hypothetical protein